MKSHIALLRGINVGGHRIIKMTDLKLLFESLGFDDVITYLQSGNVVFSPPSSRKVEDVIAETISEGIRKLYGFEVRVLVKAISEIEIIFDQCPFSEEKKKASYFTLLNSKPPGDSVKDLSELDYPEEEFFITENYVYFFSEKGYNEIKCNNNFFEKKLKVAATRVGKITLIRLTSSIRYRLD